MSTLMKTCPHPWKLQASDIINQLRCEWLSWFPLGQRGGLARVESCNRRRRSIEAAENEIQTWMERCLPISLGPMPIVYRLDWCSLENLPAKGQMCNIRSGNCARVYIFTIEEIIKLSWARSLPKVTVCPLHNGHGFCMVHYCFMLL